MTGEAGRPEGGAQVDLTGWALRGWCLSVCLVCLSWFDVLSLFGLYGFNCFRFQGCSGVLIVIEFEFNFKWGFLVIG